MTVDDHNHYQREDLGPSRLEEVGPGIFAWIQPDGGWYINNTGFLVGRKGIISIDASSTESRTKEYLGAIREVSLLPVTTLVNTHSHTDHTNGNYLFSGATIVAHEKCREMVLANGPSKTDLTGPFPNIEWGELEPAPPFLTYSTGVTIWSDETECRVRHVGGPAHTTDDSTVWLPEHSILFAGDVVFNGGAPLVSAGSVAGSLAVLRGLKTLGAQTIVPGHGDVCGPEVFDVLIAYLSFVQSLAAKGKSNRWTPLETALNEGEHQFSYLLDGERLVANLHRAYAEIDGAAPGAPIDLIATRVDMIAYNGGRPLRCHA